MMLFLLVLAVGFVLLLPAAVLWERYMVPRRVPRPRPTRQVGRVTRGRWR